MAQANTAQKDPDHELVLQAQAGSQKAFRLLYERYWKKIYRLVGSMVNSPEDADDIVQGVFVRAFSSLENFKGKSSFYTWLYRIALNATTDFRRKQARSIESSSGRPIEAVDTGELQLAAPWKEGPESELYRSELAGIVRKALETLSQEHREAILLREINGLSYAEIAELTGVSIGTVMSRLHYARKRLAEVLRRCKLLETEG